MKKKVLIIDDEKTICLSLKEGLTDLGYFASAAENGRDGLEKVLNFKPQIVFLDMRLGDENGLSLIQKIKEIDRDIEVVIMTAYGDITTAVKAIKDGAFDFIKKPFELEEINILLNNAYKSLNMKKRLYIFEKEKETNDQRIVGNHGNMKEVFEKIRILANNDSVTVLIRGETGTGKELVAEEIHRNSIRKDGPLVKINCGAIPEKLVESEFFGFEKNAFTGANSRKKGLFEIADGGTVFLDEIGEVSLETQTKLLRFIEEKKFKRVGGLKDIEVDIRIIAATNKNLEEAIKKNEFREDLYYRLNVVPINLPPLRHRKDDIILLAEYYLNTYNKKFNKCIEGFTEKAMNKLVNYNYPGNVRELKNIIERIVILNNNKYVEYNEIPLYIQKSQETIENFISEDSIKEKVLNNGFSLEYEIEKMEKKYIKEALTQTNNNHTQASKLLGISRFSLKRRIEKYFDEMSDFAN